DLRGRWRLKGLCLRRPPAGNVTVPIRHSVDVTAAGISGSETGTEQERQCNEGTQGQTLECTFDNHVNSLPLVYFDGKTECILRSNFSMCKSCNCNGQTSKSRTGVKCFAAIWKYMCLKGLARIIHEGTESGSLGGV